MSYIKKEIFSLAAITLNILTELYINDRIDFETYLQNIDAKYDFIMHEICNSEMFQTVVDD